MKNVTNWLQPTPLAYGLWPMKPGGTQGSCLGDRRVNLYVLPLSLWGTVIAAYHVLLLYGMIAEPLTRCPTISCTTSYISWWGFITFPLLALLSFSAVSLLAVLHCRLSWRQA